VQCYSFLTLALDGVCGWYHAPDVLPSGKRPTVQEADWAAGLAWKGVEKRQFLIPHRCSNPGNSIYTDCVNPSVNRWRHNQTKKLDHSGPYLGFHL